MRSEREIIEKLKKTFPKGKAELGIGDDAAIYRDLVFTTDLLVEDTHFKRSHPPFFLGRKSINVNLSDVAAMGAVPLFVLMSLSFPPRLTGDWLEEFMAGVKDACEKANCSLIGGDLSRSDKIFISVTAIGQSEKPVLRGKAREGDNIVLVGNLGEARAGREALEDGLKGFDGLKKVFLDPIPRLKEGKLASTFASSMIDVSDGLVLDLRRLLGEMGAVLNSSALQPSTQLKEYCKLKGKKPLEYMLYGGEDYALIFTTHSLPPFGMVIGKVNRGGKIFMDSYPLKESGFEHFT